jgi:CubicO group peptidase (beta-lactamase class C family)
MLRRTFLAQAAAAVTRGKMDKVTRLFNEVTKANGVASASLYVHRSKDIYRAFAGSARPDTVYILASISKPMTVTAVMTLVERGTLSLSDPVRKYIPEFHGGDRDLVTLKHLLTHTSGLPDMLPENEELRRRHAPIEEFVARTCRTGLLFKPGTQCKYQSMGILLASEIAQRVTKRPFRDFLRSTVFEPLGMTKTSLGLGGRQISDTALIQVTGNDDWNGNSSYWRNFGCPWGGVHSTVLDVARFVQYFLNPDDRVLKPATAKSMIQNQNAGLNEPWGLGWMVNPAKLARGCSPGAFGHWGSSGTLTWGDPATQTSFVLLTTKPAADSRDTVLAPVADAASEA